MIKKVHIERKANFEWIGESGLDDFVISINTVHNLSKNQCVDSLKEIQRVSKGKAFIHWFII